MKNFRDKYFDRDRTSPAVRAFGAYLYVSQGSSYRKVARLLGDLSIPVSHVAVWSWVQRLGEELEGEIFRRRVRGVIIADETKIRIEKGWIYIFAAIDTENREIVNFYVTEHCELADAWIFLQKCVECCENGPLLVTDGGPWYPWAAERLGLDHEVVSGGERNYVERWFETLKDRIRNFDVYFPMKGTRAVENFMNAFCHWYNQSRNHMTLGKPSDGSEHGFKQWMETLT